LSSSFCCWSPFSARRTPLARCRRAAYAAQNPQQALIALTMTNIRGVIGEIDLDQTLSSRERTNSSLPTILDGATKPWGMKVWRVELRKIKPPERLVRAMNLQMTAECERRAAVVKAEGEKSALILAAEGRREADFRDAEARERQAKAEAARAVGDAALCYFISERYVQAVQALGTNPASQLDVVPMEAAALAGGIAQALAFLKAEPPSPSP